MYRKILVAIDDSATSTRALDEAIRLATDQRAQLCIVHAVEPLAATLYPEAGMFADELLASLRDSAKSLLARASARAARRGITARTALIDNGGYPVAQLVLAYAKRWKPGVIVLGTHGRRGLQHLLMGSDAETILREATVPVLLVRTPGGTKKSAGRSKSATRKGSSGARAR